MARTNERRAAIERWLRLREKQGLTLREISTRSGIPEGILSWWAHRLRRKRPVDRTSVCSRIDMTAEAVSFLRRDRAQPSTAAA